MICSSPEKIITSLDDLSNIIQLVRNCRNASSGQVFEMYRGQGQNTWKLQPNIARNLIEPKRAEEIEKQIVKDFYFKLISKELSRSFQEGFFPSKFHTDWLLLQQSQHYGIPTRFMDWTIDWKTALYFAVSNSADDNFDGQFWIYIVPRDKLANEANSKYLDFDPYMFNQTIFLNSCGLLANGYLSKIAERRKTVQCGRFLIQPYDKIFTPLEEQETHKSNLTKIIIPKELKAKIRTELREENYTNEWLFVEKEVIIDEVVREVIDKYKV